MKKIIGMHSLTKLDDLLTSQFNDSVHIVISNVSTTKEDVIDYIKSHTTRNIIVKNKSCSFKSIPRDTLIILSNTTVYANKTHLSIKDIFTKYGKQFKIVLISKAHKKSLNKEYHVKLNDMSIYTLPQYKMFNILDITLFIEDIKSKTDKIKIIKHLNDAQCKQDIKKVCKAECTKCDALKQSMNKLADNLAYALVYDTSYLDNLDIGN